MSFNIFKYTTLIINKEMTLNPDENKKTVPILYKEKVAKLLQNYQIDNSEYFLEAKRIVLPKLGELFAQRRDRIRWINGYGYDCANEDITNFLAAYIKLKADHAAWEKTDKTTDKPTTQHKVYLDQKTMSKGIINIDYETMDNVYSEVRNSQFDDYAWLEMYTYRINACKNISELNVIIKELEITIP